MNVEYTQRNCEVTPAIRKQIDNGLKKLTKILGDNFETKVILVVEKHRNKAEITLSSRNRGQIVGVAISPADMTSAVAEALDRIETQARRRCGPAPRCLRSPRPGGRDQRR